MLTAHRRAWALRAGLVAVLVAGSLGGLATPALAADSTIKINSLDTASLQPGQQAKLNFTVNAGDTDSYTITITSSLAPDVTLKLNNNPCGGSCSFVQTIQQGQSGTYDVTLIASQNPNVRAGSQKSGSIQLEADPGTPGNRTATAQQQITLQGAAAPPPPPTTQAAPQVVNQVTGIVKDVTTGSAVSQAAVAMQDGAGHNFNDTTDSSGRFSFKSSNNNPISPGQLVFVITKDGYQEKDYTQNAAAGQSVTVPSIALTSTTAPTASTDPSDDPVVVPTVPSDTASVAPVPTGGAEATNTDNGGGFSTVLIVLGAILVLAGVGAIGLILWRRRNNEDRGEFDDEDGGPRRGPTPVPASRGAYRGARDDATQIARGGGYADPTMVGRDPMADAPTMLHRPVVDEYPDPYGAPDPQPQGGAYGAPGYQGGGYGADSHSGGGYGADGQRDYGRPASGGYEGGGYDATQPAYNAPAQRPAADPYASPQEYGGGAYSEPTTYGRTEPAPYGADQATSRYGADQPAPGGYGADQPTRNAYGSGGYEPGGYESGGQGSGGQGAGGQGSGGQGSGGGYQDTTRRYEGGGYGAADGYEPSSGAGRGAGGGGSYGSPSSGYQEPASGAGYGAGRGGQGYEPQGGGYDQQRGGHEAPGDGYDQRGGYEPEQRGGYQPRGGYQTPPADPYEQPRGGHAPRGGYDAPQETRRSLDWLDD